MYKRAQQINSTRGIGLVEGVVAVAIVGTVLVVLVGTFQFFLRSSARTTPEIKALFLIEEGVEAIKSIRDLGWDTDINTLALDTPYYFAPSGGRWTLSLTPEYIDGTHERVVVFSSVQRDNDGRIISSGGTVDTETRGVTVSVSWNPGSGTTTKFANFYITDLLASS